MQSWLDKRPKDWSHGSGQTKAKELGCSPSEGILMYVWNCKTGWKTIKNGLALEESPDVRKYIYYNSKTSINQIPYPVPRHFLHPAWTGFNLKSRG